MNTKRIIMIAIMALAFNACKDESVEPEVKTETPVVKKSKISLLCNEWVLKETYENDVLKTSNGTGQYRFSKNGKFAFKESGIWQDIGTFVWFNSDSSAIMMNFGGGASSEILMHIKKLEEKAYNLEFNSGGKKLNYNYVR